MPGLPSEAGGTIVTISPENHQLTPPAVHQLHHGLTPPIRRAYIHWSCGNVLHVACLRQLPSETGPVSCAVDEPGGKVGKMRLESTVDDDASQFRRIAYGSVVPFAVLQRQKNALAALQQMQPSFIRTEWWQHVLDYSTSIRAILENPKPNIPIIGDPKIVQVHEEPTTLKAAWELMEIFYVDKRLSNWLPERLVDWLADHDCLLSVLGSTAFSKVADFQKKLIKLQVIEDDQDYWEVLSAAVAIGWFDIAVNLLRMHGSYQSSQLDNRETENGLVEAVVVLISTMPRMRPDVSAGKLGQCFQNKPEFMKAWDKWRGQVTKLECSAFWIQCGHNKTRDGLRTMLQIMLGNFNISAAATFHWMELFITHFLYIKPFIAGIEAMHQLAQKCMQLKESSYNNGLTRLVVGVLSENIEVVLAECTNSFGPWMVVHATELLTTDSEYADALLHEDIYNLGGISVEELHRLTYAQVLASDSLTWQIAPTYLSSCPTQGPGMLEILLSKQPVNNSQTVLKALEICRLYDLENVSSSIMKITGIFHWKHGSKGTGIFWFQQACDKICLDRICQELLENVSKSVSDDRFMQWEGLINLLHSNDQAAGGLEFLHKYVDYKRSLQKVLSEKDCNFARQMLESLLQLVKNPSAPQRYLLLLLHDSIKLLNWTARPFLNVSETNFLLNKLQEISLAKLKPNYIDDGLPQEAVSSIRLALAKNLMCANLEEP